MVEQRTLPEMLADIKQSQQAFLDSLAEFIQHFIVEHDQVHVGQVRALLA